MKRIIVIPSTRILAIIWVLSLFIILILTISINTNPTVEAKFVFSKKWGTLGSGNGEFKSPEGIAIDSSGRVYIADTGNNRIQQFRLANPCPSGTSQTESGVCFVRSWGSLGTGNGQFNKPLDVALDSTGRVYVADSDNKRIQMFKGNGDFIRTWNTDGPGTAQFGKIVGITVDNSNTEIYAADSKIQGQGVVHKFRLANSCAVGTSQVVAGVCFVVKWTYGQPPEVPPDPFHSLLGISVNSVTHNVYVSHYQDYDVPISKSDENWILREADNGNHLTEWGGDISSADGKLNRATGIAIGPSGLIYVADTGNNRIQTFQLVKPVGLCPAGTAKVTLGVCLLTKWGTPGSANGQFDFPSDIAVGPSGHIYVADTGNNRIQVFYWKTDVGGPGGGGNLPGSAVK